MTTAANAQKIHQFDPDSPAVKGILGGTSLQVNPALADLIVGLSPEAGMYSYSRAAPKWDVDLPSGRYPIWNRGDMMRDDAQIAGAGTAPPLGMPRLSNREYFCQHYSRGCLITEMDRKLWASLFPRVNIDEMMVNHLANIIRIRLERRFAQICFPSSGTWNRTRTGVTHFTQFDNQTTGKPVETVKSELLLLGRAINKPKTDLIAVMARAGMDNLEEHPQIVGKYEQTQTALMEKTDVQKAWRCKDIIVSDAVYASSNPVDDATDSSTTVTPIIGNHILLTYAPQDATGVQPSGAKMACLTMDGMNEDGFRVRTIEHAGLDGLTGTIHIVETFADFVVCMPAAGTLLYDAFSAAVV